MRKYFVRLVLVVLVVVFSGWSSGASAVPVEWTVASGGNGHFYEVEFASQISWSDARANALALGAGWDLASVTSQGEQDFIISLLPASPSSRDHYYLGGSDSVAEGTWVWSDGETFTYTNWWDGEHAACGHRSPSRMMDVERSQHTSLDSSYASSPADDSVEAAEKPPPPTQDVLPKATGVALSLIKPASTFT